MSYSYDTYGRFSSLQSGTGAETNLFTYSYLPDSDLLSGYTATTLSTGSTNLTVSKAYELNRNLIAAATNSVGSVPDPETVAERLETLRKHRWSSYPAYAGYVEKPPWLCCEELWRRGGEKDGDPKKEFREWIEDYLKQGIEENRFSKLKSSVAVGSAAFIAKLRKEVLKDRGTKSNKLMWKRLLSFEEVIKAVEDVKGEPWDLFRCRRGDSGRDIVLSIARSSCGLTLREIGGKADMSFDAVSKAVVRLNRRMAVDEDLKIQYEEVVSRLENPL